MKRNLLLSAGLMMAIFIRAFAQDLGDQDYTLNFEDTATLHHLIIDSTSNHNNLWQIGAPQKTIFTNAWNAPNAIVTDTIFPYPINDTSSFEIVNVVNGFGWQSEAVVFFTANYQVNSDTLSDYGTIEFSPDNGITWIDLLNDTVYSNYYTWGGAKPILSGNSNGWQLFWVWLAPLGPLFNVQLGDTILYRFTFISDSIQSNKDGLMFDNLRFEDYAVGIQEIQNGNLISISPNPTDENLFIHKTKNSSKQSIQVFNYTGKLVFENANFIGETIDTRQLVNGIYLLKYSDGTSYSMKKFVVEH